MKRFLKAVTLIAIVSILLSGSFLLFLRVTEANVDKLPQLKNGDLVFQTTSTSQTLPIMAASSSLYTHVGIVKINRGVPHVIEAVGPVREITLQKWIDQGVGKRLTIKRLPELSNNKAREIFNNARKYYGNSYDFWFLFGNKEVYCSELIHLAYEPEGIILGEIEKLKDLKIANGPVMNLMKKRWKTYPPCKKQGVATFEECMPIILEQTLITPASIANDSSLQTIYSNYGI